MATVVVFGFTACDDDDDNEQVIEQPADAATFENVTLGADSVLDYTNGSSFTVNGYTFNYTYTAAYGSWSGFVAAGKQDTSFKDYTTDKNTCVGHGYAGSKNYIVYYPTYGAPSTIDLPSVQTVRGFYGAVNTYVQNSITKGDGFARAFKQGDFLRLDCIGVKADNTTDTISYYLADYTGAALTYAKDWTWFDLSKLGNIKALYFAFDGTDKGQYGLNTPTYVLIDNFNGAYDGKSNSAVAVSRK